MEKVPLQHSSQALRRLRVEMERMTMTMKPCSLMKTPYYSYCIQTQKIQMRVLILLELMTLVVCHNVRVLIQGVPAYGIIDTAADITIIGGQLFRKVVSVAHLKKKHLKPPDKTPRNYDQRPFRLDGRMELNIAFDDKEMTTSVYIKLDAADQLLLSEGVCRLLGIVSYHSDVEIWRGGKQPSRRLLFLLTLLKMFVVIIKQHMSPLSEFQGSSQFVCYLITGLWCQWK